VGTAHPAKFPDAVEMATGRPPISPPRIAALADREEDFKVLPATVDAVSGYVTWRIDE